MKMLCGLMALGLFASTAQAVELKAVGTLNIGKTTNDRGFPTDGLSRFGFGALVTTSPVISGLFGIQTGLLYTPVGASADPYEYWTNYLQVPVLLKFTLPLVSIGFGPYFGIPLSAGASGPGISSNGGDPEKVFDWGLMATFGAKYPITDFEMRPLSVAFDIGYQFGFGNVTEVPNASSHVRNLQLQLGLAFDL